MWLFVWWLCKLGMVWWFDGGLLERKLFGGFGVILWNSLVELQRFDVSIRKGGGRG